MEEIEGAASVDGMGTDEGFHFATVADAEAGCVEESDLGELPGDGFVGSDAVEVATFDHEGAWGDEGGHFGVVEGAAEVELEDFVFAGPDIAVAALGTGGGGILADPFIEVGGTDGQDVTGDERRDAHGGFAAVTEAIEADAGGVDKGQVLEPGDDLLMLRDDGGEEGLAEGITLALEGAETVFEDVGVLGRERDESAVREASGVVVIGVVISFDEVLGATFKSVLADHHRTTFAGLEILWNQQDSVRDDVGEHIEDDFVTGPAFAFVGAAGARGGRQQRVVEATDDFFGELLAIRFDGPGMGFDGRGVEPAHEGAAHLRADREQMLIVAVDLMELTELAVDGIGEWTGDVEGSGSGGEGGVWMELMEERLKGFSGGERALAGVAAGQGEAGLGLQRLDEMSESGELGFDHADFRRGEAAGSTAAVASEGQFRTLRGFNHEGTRRNHGCEFGVAKMLEKPEHGTVEGFLPDAGTVIEMATDCDRLDAGVEGAGEQRDPSAFTPAEDSDGKGGGLVGGGGRVPIDQGEDLLDFVAGDGATEFEGGAMEEFAGSEAGTSEVGTAIPVDDDGDDDAAPAFGETAGELGFGKNAGDETGELFGGMGGVGDGDDGGDGRLAGGGQEEAFALDIGKGVPTDGVDFVAVVTGQQ